MSTMFEERKKRKAAKQYEKQFANWQSQRNSYAELMQTAEGSGETVPELVCKPGEAVFAKVTRPPSLKIGVVQGNFSAGRVESPSRSASITTEHHRGDFLFSNHFSRSLCAPRTCALFVIRTAHYS